ncbi:MAG: HDIG domain-containing protein [Ardenticatenaceae bacterium]|nr:HDIG domain-containing protein [Ardenticatenaceae bacterium]MCB8947487.1 HDIG domain-containing protein [Ardenticatenaceae bacterium]
MTAQTDERPGWRKALQSSWLWIFAVVVTLGLTIIFSFNLVTASDVQVTVGQPASEDIFSPRSVTYESDVLLASERANARAAVPEQYSGDGSDIGRSQLNLVTSVFAFVDAVRADSLATKETKLSYLQAINNLTVQEQIGLSLLDLSSADYDVVKREISRIVGDLMRQDIREDQVREYQIIARREASLELTPVQESVVTNIAPQFIVPTVFPDPDATAALREAAVEGIGPFVITIADNERIVRQGDPVTDLDIEKLTRVGLLQRQLDWRDVGAIFVASLLSVVLVTMYWHQFFWDRVRDNGRYLTVLTSLLLVFAAIAKLMLTGGSFFPYLFPMAALSMLLSVIYDVRFSLTVTIIMAALYGFLAPNSLELAAYTAVGGLLAILTLQDAQRINAFFRAGLAAAIGYCAAILIFRLNQDMIDVIDMLELMGYAVVNGVLSSALTLVGFFILGSLFGITTTLQLQELARLDHPLLQELLRRAPGTYHHSIMVANLAEQAAEQIKANSALIRVGAFYHDIGKMNRPPFYSENQEGVNPHDALDPQTSARIILSHVSDGLELAKRYKLPYRIQQFIAEHHGRRLVKGFYFKAKEQAAEGETVDPDKFRYSGPRPHTRETAVVMLADVIESTSRALQPNSEKAIEKLVNSLIDEDLTEGQLDESGLTLGDIRKIRESFIKTLKGRFHVRVKYPGNDELLSPAEQAATQTAVAQPNLPADVAPVPLKEEMS